MSEATRISQVVAGLARRHEGTPFWSGPAYHPAARRHNASDGRAGLLDGSAGIALGLAAVAATTARPDLAAMARASLLPLCGPLLDVAPRLARGTWDPGIGTGAASCAYGLLRCRSTPSCPATFTSLPTVASPSRKMGSATRRRWR